jgi:tetratricopeptide (TPR) repeat protein
MRVNVISILLILLLGFTSLTIAWDVRVSTSSQDPGLPAYIEARRMMLSGRFAEAAEKFESFLSVFSSSHRADDAMYYLGFCREQLGQKQQAFYRYREVLDRYKSSNAYRRALERAIDLARELRRAKGDEYDKFLMTYVRTGSGDYYAIQSAISLAEIGDWSGQPLLVSGLQKGNEFQQIRIANLLLMKLGEEEVRSAYESALKNSRNEIVRMTAASALSSLTQYGTVRQTLALALEKDSNSMVKISAAFALSPHINDKDVEQAFVWVLRFERDPMVLINVVDSMRARDISEPVKQEIVKRFELEPSPMLKYALMNGINDRMKVEISEDVFINLINDPAPAVRLHALNLLAPKADDPRIKEILVSTLKTDPDISVKIASITLLADKVIEKDVRDAMIAATVEHADETSLASYTIRVLSTHIEIPEIRGQLVELLESDTPRSPIVTAELVAGLTSVAEEPQVQDALLELLEGSADRNIKMFTLRRIRRIEGDERLKRLEALYKNEKDEVLAGGYLRLIAQSDPERAKAISKQGTKN